MARKPPTRQGTTRPADSAGRPRRKLSKLASFVKSLKSRAAAAKRPAPAAAQKKPLVRSVKSAPVRRVSVVKKPAKGPGRPAAAVRAARKSPAAASPVPLVSVVKKPSRGPAGRRVGIRRGREARRVRPTTGFTATPASGAPPAAFVPEGSAPPAARVQPAVPPHAAAQEPPFSIPTGYGDNRILLMVKDPWWLYAYWEIQPSVERAARAQLLPQDIPGLQTVLRVHDVTGRLFPEEPSHHFFDIGLSGMASNWYIKTDAPDRSFIVEIGLLTHTGKFLLLARSNRVTAPRFGPSDVIDEQWMTTDEAYWKLFGAAAGIGVGSSQGGSAHILPQAFFSGGWSSSSLYGIGKPSAVRGFWCRVNTDLVIHGAAEARSHVTVQGQPVAVRKDGTFSLRIALPRGTQTVTIEVTSPDGRKTTTLTPVVTMEWTGPLGSGDPAAASPTPRHPELL